MTRSSPGQGVQTRASRPEASGPKAQGGQGTGRVGAVRWRQTALVHLNLGRRAFRIYWQRAQTEVEDGTGGAIVAAFSRRDWPLLVLLFAGKPLYPVHLQKILFLLGKALPEGDQKAFYGFRHYDYGPFSSAIYEDLEVAEQNGYVEIQQGRVRTYALTPEGTDRAQAVLPLAAPATRAHLEDLCTWASGLTFSQIVKAVYARYPETRQNSVFVE